MSKIKIKIIILGHVPQINVKRILEWKSSIFQFDDKIETITLSGNGEGDEREYLDSQFIDQVPNVDDGSLIFAITNVPIEEGYYSRVLNGRKFIFTLHEIKDYLDNAHIPIENAIIRMIYSYSLRLMVIEKQGVNISFTTSDIENFTHDETRGCIFDFNSYKYTIASSCDKPTICSHCLYSLSESKISQEIIKDVQKELKNINKILFYRISDFIKKHPFLSLFISLATAFILSFSSSFLATIFYVYFFAN